MKTSNFTCHFLLMVMMVFGISCSKDHLDEQDKENATDSTDPFAPATFKSGDRLYELTPTGNIRNYYDILSNGKIKYGSATVASNYSYSRLSDSTALFTCTIQQNTDLYAESYIRWWKYDGVLTWKSKTECKGKFICKFTSTKFPSTTTNEIINFRYEANANNTPDDNDDEDKNPSREFILEQIRIFENKKAEAEKQLHVYQSWEPSAITAALINTQMELINTYERMIQKWKDKLK